jgi:hypothetical protein
MDDHWCLGRTALFHVHPLLPAVPGTPVAVASAVGAVGAGAASLYVPRYIAEVAPPLLRGRLGSLNQVDL